MKNGSKSQRQSGGQSLGKRDAPESGPKDMEAELMRLMRENDKLKNQLSTSQGEVCSK